MIVVKTQTKTKTMKVTRTLNHNAHNIIIFVAGEVVDVVVIIDTIIRMQVQVTTIHTPALKVMKQRKNIMAM
jgi:hypothetical protein